MFSLGTKKCIFFLTVAAFQTSFLIKLVGIDVKLNRFLLQNASVLCIRGNLHAAGSSVRKILQARIVGCHFFLQFNTSHGLHWLPRWLRGKESACQGRKYRFNPWLRKIPWRRQWQPSPVFLLEKSHGQRSLAGYSPCGRKRVRHD